VRFLQIGMDIMARDPAVIDAVQKHSPMIRNNLLLLISNRDYQKLMTREGKEELRGEALAEVKKIMTQETGKAGVEDLLFTSFVVQ
jgi:flagellar FliL protein